MIVLDTNVVSEPLRPSPAPQVLAWLDAQDPRTLFLTTVSVAELLVGATYLPEGRRRSELEVGITSAMAQLFGARLLPFDMSAATAFAPMMAKARAQGVQVGFADGQIAAFAATRGFAVATRDVEPFEAMGVRVIDPWMA